MILHVVTSESTKYTLKKRKKSSSNRVKAALLN